MTASHEPHHLFLAFSSSSSPAPNPAAMAMAFDHQDLLASLHNDTTLRAGGGGDTTPWLPPPQVVSLPLYHTAGSGSSSLVGDGQHEQPFTVALLWMVSMQPCFRLESSRYLGHAKELLGEFCSLEGDMHGGPRTRAPNRDDVEASSLACSPWGVNPSPGSMDYMALERRKARLLSMVEEVDMRYRRYRQLMRATEMSFEAMAGTGAAHVYTKLAMHDMSRHFRCLRDAVVGQIRVLKKSMGESRDTGGVSAAPGTSKGDTPRLRVLDQCLRQQRTFQQFGGAAAIESYLWRPHRGLPERAIAVLRSWLFEHFLHPYPNDVDKQILARQSGLSRSQVSNWFINARVRLWKPMIEDLYAEEAKQHDDGGAGVGQGKPATADRGHSSNTAAWTTAAAAGDQSPHHLGGRNKPTSCFVPSSSLVENRALVRAWPAH